MIPSLVNLDTFGISPTRGFLSTEAPVAAFSDTYYKKWDQLVTELPALIRSHRLQEEIRSLSLLSVSHLSSELEFRRAYVVLGFLVHAYVWRGSEDGKPIETVPPQLAEPFLAVCNHFGMEPVLSYAGLCLWNWIAKETVSTEEESCFKLEQLELAASFTDTLGETAFLLVPVLVEAEGGRLVPLLLRAVAAADRGDNASVTDALRITAGVFIRMGHHLSKIYALLDAHMFYHELRPFFSGGKGMEDKGLPRGMVFQRSDGSEQPVKVAGGSAAQSSLFPFLDSVLGVQHKEPGGAEVAIFKEMRLYMPGQHREFLELASTLPSIRSFVQTNLSDEVLFDAYEGCMKQLRLWRSKHIAVVSKYIVRPARAAQKGSQVTGCEAGREDELKGSGGADLIPFLRQSRDETMECHT